MRIALAIAVILIAIAAVIALVGWMLPVAHVASSSAFVAKPPERVYAIVSDLPSYPNWWRDDPGVKSEIVDATPPSRFVTRVVDPDGQFGGTWTIDIGAEGSGSRLTITERGEVYNPIFRFLSRFVFGHTGTMNSFLEAIQQAP